MNIHKIAFFHNGVFASGGTEQVALRLADWFAAHGYETYVIAESIGDGAMPEHIARKTVCLTMSREQARNADTRARFLVECCNSRRIDVVLMMGGYLRTLGEVAGKVDSHIVYCCHSKPLWETQMTMAKWDRRHSLAARMPWGGIVRGIKRRIVCRRTARRYLRTWRSVERYVVLCNAYLDELRAALGIDAASDGKTLAIYNASKSAGRPDAPTAPRRRVLFVGRLTYTDKRVDRLLAVWSRLQDDFEDWSLDIVGDGEERAELERMADSLHLKRVSFCGWQSDTVSYYDRAAVLCMTSSYEGWPLVVAEAQQRGVIPVAFDCSAGVREIIEVGGGVLVRPFDMEAYAEALRDLLSSPSRRACIAEKILADRGLYDPDRIGAEWERLFASLDSRRAR